MNALFSEPIPPPPEEIPVTQPMILSAPSDRFEEVVAEQSLEVFEPTGILSQLEHAGMEPVSSVDLFPVLPAALRKRRRPRKVQVPPEVVTSEPLSAIPISAPSQLCLRSSPPPKLSMISCLNWNIRGVANLASKRRLAKLCHIHQVSILILQEPFLSSDHICGLKDYLRFHDCLSSANSKIWIF